MRGTGPPALFSFWFAIICLSFAPSRWPKAAALLMYLAK